MFGLQAAAYGNDFFYVHYWIAVPDLCPVGVPTPILECGMLLNEGLRNLDGSSGFDRKDKKAIEESAGRILGQFRKLALPWFAGLNSWGAIAAEYLRVNPIEEEMLGKHSTVYGADFRSATYGYLLFRANRSVDALRWLREAERLMALPVYIARNGQVVHIKEKYARLQKPTAYEIEALGLVRQTIELIESSA